MINERNGEHVLNFPAAWKLYRYACSRRSTWPGRRRRRTHFFVFVSLLTAVNGLIFYYFAYSTLSFRLVSSRLVRLTLHLVSGNIKLRIENKTYIDTYFAHTRTHIYLLLLPLYPSLSLALSLALSQSCIIACCLHCATHMLAQLLLNLNLNPPIFFSLFLHCSSYFLFSHFPHFVLHAFFLYLRSILFLAHFPSLSFMP